jgi:hypothetical protein
MSKFSKKFVSAALSAVTAVSMSGAMMLIPVAHAQSTTDLQAQIAALLAQINQLQAQLGASTGGSTVSANFTRDLTVGSKGDDVSALQSILISKGYLKIASPTSYFGSMTKAALAAWQAASGISPAVGYFGPKSRAAMNGMATTPTTPTTPGTPAPIPGAGLSVGLSASNPSAGSLISSSASAASRVPVLAVNVTAGTASGITLTGMKFKKLGVLSDSSISGAYLEESGKVLSQYNSITSGKVVFTNLGINIAAGQTRTLVLSIDPASALSAGNTVSFGLESLADVTALDAANAAAMINGAFPLNGNLFTVTSVSNPSLGTLTIASSSMGTSLNAGSNDNVVGAWSFTAGNSALWLKGLNLKVIGSANKSDIRNVKLLVNGTQVGSTLTSVAADGTAYFDLTSAPAKLNTGANSVQVRADIAGSPSYNFQFEILNSYDILAVDSQYNVPVTAGSNTGTQVTINTGSITLQKASDSPSGSISAGQSGVTLAKFTFYAAGEAVKVKWLGWGLNFTNASSQLSIDSQVKNVSLVSDAGDQVGTTVNTLSTTVTCTDTAQAVSTSSYRGCFGSSGSPINYIVPAKTTRVLMLKADIQSTAVFGTIAGIITANTSNLQGLTSSQTASTAAASGNALTFSSSALTVAQNSAIGTPAVTPGATGQKIGSYNLSASSAEGVNVSTITVLLGATGAQFSNLVVKVGGVQFGSNQPTLANSTSYTFSGTQFTVPKSGTVNVDVYADVLTSATAALKATLTTLSGCTANGTPSLTSISCTSTAGQSVNVAGQATLTVSSANQSSDQIVMGTTGATLAQFSFQETSNVEDIKVTDLIVFQGSASTSTRNINFSNLGLYQGATQVGFVQGSYNIAASSSNPTRGFYWKFKFGDGLKVPQTQVVVLTLKGDVNSYISSSAADNTTSVFRIATSTDSDNDTTAETVVAMGWNSQATSSITLSSAVGPTKTILRSKVAFSATPTGTTVQRVDGTELGRLNFSVDSGKTASINSIVITFSGVSASVAGFLDGVLLYDSDVPATALGTGNVTSTACDYAGATTTCTKSFLLGATTAGLDVGTNGALTKTLILKYNGGSAIKAQGSTLTPGITASIAALANIEYTDDATDSSAASGIVLPSNLSVPIQIGNHSSTLGV